MKRWMCSNGHSQRDKVRRHQTVKDLRLAWPLFFAKHCLTSVHFISLSNRL
jgi:hypothetical protein